MKWLALALIAVPSFMDVRALLAGGKKGEAALYIVLAAAAAGVAALLLLTDIRVDSLIDIMRLPA